MNSHVLGFNGERLDPISGTTHLGNGYRAYNPVLMLFNSPDSLSPFFDGGINSYAYCAGDPVNQADPSGHMSWQAGLGVGLGILGILGAVYTAGASIAATGCINAALGATSATGLITGSLALIADVSGIASAMTTSNNPGASVALGWVSLAAGLLSLGFGLAPKLGSIVGRANQGLGKWLQDKVTFLGKIEKRERGAGIPASGEFRSPTFLGKYTLNGQTQWSFRFEDYIPMGQRLNIVVGSELINSYHQAIGEIQVGNRWFSRVFTPARLRDHVLTQGESFDVYRIVMPYSGVTSRGHLSFARRFFDVLTENRPVVGFRDSPVWTGPVAEHLQATFSTLTQLENAGYGSLWASNTAQGLLQGLEQRYEAIPDALTFTGDVDVFPLELRGVHALNNYL